MNFPDEPIFRALHWFIDTPALGGIAVITVAVGILVFASIVLRWISLGAEADEQEVYTYPTPALLGHHDND